MHIPNFVLLITLSLILFGFNGNSQNKIHTLDRLSFDANWKFIQQDIHGAEQIHFDDTDWRTLNLPHDWSIEGEYKENNPMGDKGGYLPAGFGWYRKTIVVPQDWKGKHVEIAFDGVFMNSTVWANGQELGTRPYGWISFAYDVSDIVQKSDKITFAVRVDNDKQPSARWYTGSGIYTHPWIDLNNNTQIKRDGIFVRTEGDNVFIETELYNNDNKRKSAKLITSIVDENGIVVTRIKDKIKLDKEALIKTDLNINNPKLWSTESPYLYTLRPLQGGSFNL